MVPVLAADRRPVAQHHPLGASTGWLDAPRGAWDRLADQALDTSVFAVELAALAEPELPGLLAWLRAAPALPFRYLSVHAPSKERTLDDARLVDALLELLPRVDAIVVHPDTIQEVVPWRALGGTLVLENMDARKGDGRTADELAPYFAALPAAGLCLDVAHVASIDPSMREGDRILDRFGARLRHLHVSSLDDDCHHQALTADDERRFTPLLARSRDVPWILEAPLL
ncbi:TIM barrel protein [Conexibacter sp. SYSU D00693]|uniref:TIM barrel protein n=1 Tax=Conexibacter sp. SYSU D00693 TaxID=2812560 RepID=UPI00196B812E|nr:TIM barrel protein [Conexibacter sp. SYSU D00693]